MSGSLPYRPAVGAMLLNRHGLVFVGRRIDQTVEGWQMPQGGIDDGEDPAEAVFREVKEEVGTAKAEIMAEMDEWVTYDLPPHLVGIAFHGKFRGQRQKWFALRFLGENEDIDLFAHEPEFSAWKWLEIEELPGVIVPFKRASYAKVIAAFRHLAKPL
ncbi:MAG: RNA pyrophosphohydrolase [Rhizomicrobium sp.]